MIKYICDLCGKESKYLNKYYIPNDVFKWKIQISTITFM